MRRALPSCNDTFDGRVRRSGRQPASSRRHLPANHVHGVRRGRIRQLGQRSGRSRLRRQRPCRSRRRSSVCRGHRGAVLALLPAPRADDLCCDGELGGRLAGDRTPRTAARPTPARERDLLRNLTGTELMATPQSAPLTTTPRKSGAGKPLRIRTNDEAPPRYLGWRNAADKLAEAQAVESSPAPGKGATGGSESRPGRHSGSESRPAGSDIRPAWSEFRPVFGP